MNSFHSLNTIRSDGTGCQIPLHRASTQRKPSGFVAGLIALLFVQTGLAIETELVPVTPTSTPFFSALTDLEPQGYTEDEYFVSGTANIYQYNASLEIEVMTPDVAYTNRIMIRRPENPNDFNGVVVFEMLNPTATWDIDFIWQFAQDYLMSEGYIWVGLTMRPVAVNTLKAFDPVRYDPINLIERGLSYDIFGDIGVLLRDPADPENPLASYDVTHVIGTGYSQTDDWLTTFSNELHEAKVAWDGALAFDGYLGANGNAAAHSIWSGDPDALYGRFYDDERRLNSVNAPYFRTASETELEIFTFPSNNVRQPDSDVYRQWEVAGTTHADSPSTATVSATTQRDLGFSFPACEHQPTGDVAMAPFIRAALHHLRNWVSDGTLPPPSKYIQLNGTNDVARDEFGNALGGIRIPELEAPIGSYVPFNSGLGPCIFAPSLFPFSQEELDALYPNFGSYKSKFVQAVNQLRQQGYLLEEDADAYKQKATKSDIGQ